MKSALDEFPRNVQVLVRGKRGGIFKDMEVASGSIGIVAARIWKQEVAMVILDAGFDTPWDNAPIIGMNRQLRIVHIKVNPANGEAEVFTPKAPTVVARRNYVEIMVHESYADQVVNWLNARKFA